MNWQRLFIMNLPQISLQVLMIMKMTCNIPNTPAYGVFISQLIRYSRICSDFSSFQAKSLQLCSRLIKQGYKYFKLKSTFKTFLTRQPLVRIKYKQKVASMLKDCLVLPHIVLPHLQRNVTTRRPKGRLT